MSKAARFLALVLCILLLGGITAAHAEMVTVGITLTGLIPDGNGVYLAYKAVQNNEAETGVAGRIIVNTVNKTLYILHVSYPRGLADTFAEGVYNKVRHSMKLAE